MRSIRCLFWLGMAAAASLCHGAEDAHTHARLLLSADAARPGETIIAGVQLRMDPDWHTYWRNSGDSGLPTKIKWELPPGVTAATGATPNASGSPAAILWPPPEKLTAADLTTYVYHDEVVLLVPITIGPNAPTGSVELKAHLSWLECSKECLPGAADLSRKLMIGPESKISSEAPILETWQQKIPRPRPGLDAQAWWEAEAKNGKRPLALQWTPDPAASEGDFFPYASDDYTILPPTDNVGGKGRIRLRKMVEKYEGNWPTQAAGLFIEEAAGKRLGAYEGAVPILASAPANAVAASRSAPPATGAARNPESLALMLVFAFLGGLILNVMPCVLPVIALKILGFVNQSREEPRRVRQLGLVYALGVLVSFLFLAGIVVGVQQAGRAASWGMQFGNPYFLVAMTVLVTLVALNLFGVFEIALGGRAMGAVGALAGREGASGAFFNGVLATALATPCTAPFLSVALGFAFAQPPVMIVLMFLVIGAGLALPFVIVSFFPRLLQFMPKPGLWMERFKVLMGFPMLATAVWLFSIIERHYGQSGVLWVGLFLTFVALAAWIWGTFVQRGSKRKPLAVAAAVLLLIAGYVYPLEVALDWRAPRTENRSGALAQHRGGIPWQAWSPEAVQKARAEGRPVLVDFTADWCLTCQANKTSSLEISSVRQKLKDINAVALLGDYTLFPPEITEELKRFGRAGVPLVLVYPAKAGAEPEVLPTLLTPSIVLDALERAAPQNETLSSSVK